MLQVKGISKEYKTGDFVQRALDDVTLSLRDNEFVAVLGPSGSGKTTLLNVIGGLDRYDSGDLIINGTSTKKYNDRDWDAYRNHSVGFIFQSYNLIPHQSVLANVELALTIAGISKSERTKRAREALERVGLGEHINKKPNQLSGGQMQRVAIARALINEPTVLLADEPTGALDSETSVSVMELLKDVAKDRLVVMVTHNPELADTYANRVVELKDGRIVGDSNPFEPLKAEPADTKRLGRASMSFLTALGLSFNNLRTKLRRTLLVSFAGSIGIIGIALILSLSNGLNRYMDDIQRETLSEYPIEITRNSVDLTSFLNIGTSAAALGFEKNEAEVTEDRFISTMFSMVAKNDLKSFKVYLDNNRKELDRYAQALEYGYNITPQIYSLNSGKIRQVNPDRSFESVGFMTGMLSGFADCFSLMPENEELYRNQYDVKAGRWPEKFNELVLVINADGTISDMLLYTLGKKDVSQLDDMVDRFLSGKTQKGPGERLTYDYKDFLGISFRLVKPVDFYFYDDTHGIWTDRTEDAEALKTIVKDAEKLEIVGVVQQRENATVAMLGIGINYLPDLVYHIVDASKDSDIVKAQMEDPKTNVLTGEPFGDEAGILPDFSEILSINPAALANAFSINEAAVQNIDISKLMPAIGDAETDVDPEVMQEALSELLTAYLDYASDNPKTDYANMSDALSDYLATQDAQSVITAYLGKAVSGSGESVITSERMQRLISSVMQGFSDYVINTAGVDPRHMILEYLAGNISIDDVQAMFDKYLGDYLQTPDAQQRINAEVAGMQDELLKNALSEENLQSLFSGLLSGYETYAEENDKPTPSAFQDSFSEFMKTEKARGILGSAFSATVTEQDAELDPAVLQELASGMFTIDPSAFAGAFSMNMDEDELKSLMSSYMSGGSATYEDNLSMFGYADMEDPYHITIYPKNFETKGEITRMIEKYNKDMTDTKQDSKVIRYSDMIGAMMGSITKIINSISYVLVAFVAVSLIVSSIMIGVITYISVLERNKEIGILRAIGASKRNISSVFNAETFIIGALSGLIGVIIARILLIPGNHLIHVLANQSDLNAYLPVHIALALVALSIVLTLIGGFIPSKAAARRDPVAALRTE